MNFKDLKKLTPDLLQKYGIDLYKDGKSTKIFCLVHGEKNPSAQLNANGTIFCHGCGAIYDVFDCVGILEGIQGPKNQLKFLCDSFGIVNTEDIRFEKQTKPLFRGHVSHSKFVPLPIDTARRIYGKTRTLDLLSRFGINGDFVAAYPYLSETGFVNAVDYRVDENFNKQVVTVWFDGHNIRIKDPPNLIWGLDHIDKEKPCLIVEGAKCASIAHEKIGDNFAVHTWNRGTNGARYCDWSPIGIYDQIFIMYDADRKKTPEGEMLPTDNQPGRKCALEIMDRLLEINENCEVTLMEPHGDCLKLKPDGADIVEMFEIFSPDEVCDFILGR
jgi:hypothetical protein